MPVTRFATCTDSVKPRMGLTEDHPSGIISVMGIWKLKPIYTNPSHNNETQGTGTPTSQRVTGILFLSEVPTNKHSLYSQDRSEEQNKWKEELALVR